MAKQAVSSLYKFAVIFVVQHMRKALNMLELITVNSSVHWNMLLNETITLKYV